MLQAKSVMRFDLGRRKGKVIRYAIGREDFDDQVVSANFRLVVTTSDGARGLGRHERGCMTERHHRSRFDSAVSFHDAAGS